MLNDLDTNNNENKQLNNLNETNTLKYYKPNGSFYLISPQQLIKYKTFITKRAIGVLIKNEKEQIDINYKSDFKYAKQFI